MYTDFSRMRFESEWVWLKTLRFFAWPKILFSSCTLVNLTIKPRLHISSAMRSEVK